MNINELKKEIDAAITQIKNENDCATFHQKYLSKSGIITNQMATIKDLPADQRGKFGADINILKRDTESRLFILQSQIKERELNNKLMQDNLVDITIPDITRETGSLHPITRIAREVEEVFASMGFHIESGREIVTEYENFESVNVPNNHPARDMQDTFWLSNGNVLKTHTSALQNILLKKHGPSFSAIFPGRCYRNENLDATHEMAFFQVEGMMVGENITISNLIYFLKTALTTVFKKEIDVRLRPGFFPFTEPSFEFDMSCIFCGTKDGCSICKKSGWIEFCGCGMIHPNVLEMGGVDPNKYQGFAFGFGLTRLVMMKYGISDIRVFNSGNLEALKSI